MHARNKWLLGGFSAVLLGAAALWEGTKYKPYEDIVGVLTVCNGYTGKDIVRNKTYTPQECQQLLKKELYIHAEGILKCIRVPLAQNEFDAYTLFAYNVGVAGACGSRAFSLLNQERRQEACRALAFSPSNTPVWSFAGGRFVQGLHNRRMYEMNMCMGKMNVQYAN
jgi:lysozyme